MTKFSIQPLFVALALSLSVSAHAQSVSKAPGVQVAQFDADDTYDPFADYSEFDEAQDEEADINFFRNGRFVYGRLSRLYRGSRTNVSVVARLRPLLELFL